MSYGILKKNRTTESPELIEPRNPILDLKLVSEFSWKQWLDLWESTPVDWVEYRESLLSLALKAGTHSYEENAQRIIFFIKLADQAEKWVRAWYPDFNCKKQKDAEEKLSKKALQILFEQILREEGDSRPPYGIPNWFSKIFMPNVLEELAWFFDRNNLPAFWEDERHSLRVMRKFAVKFAQLAFMGFSRDELHPREVERLRKFRAEFIALLYDTKEVKYLLEASYPLTAREMVIFRRIILTDNGRRDSGVFKTIEEVVGCQASGFYAAGTFMLLRVKMRAESRKKAQRLELEAKLSVAVGKVEESKKRIKFLREEVSAPETPLERVVKAREELSEALGQMPELNKNIAEAQSQLRSL